MSNVASIEPMEAPKNQTQLLLKTHTSTDGSVSPKPRWSRGVPPTFEEDAAATSHKPAKEESATPTTTAATSDAEDEEEVPPSPPSLRSGGRSNVSSTASKSYVAWRWLVEDEADTEPRLNKPAADDGPLVLPELLEGERELLCRHVELRLREVDRQSDDISALVDEYLRFMWLRQRLESMLTLDPSPLVDDVWQAHITLESDYAGFCERTFGGERLDQGVPHREIDPSQPVLYENTVGAYEHFFGACPPAEFWPKVPTAAAGPALDGEETGGADFSGRRKAFVRSAEEHFRFSEE